MKTIYALLALACFLPQTAHAQTTQDLKKIENYLNSIKTLEARFVQNASNGNISEGHLWIEKPNKIRMEYDAPANILIVGNGDFIVFHDKDLDQVSNIDYEDIPASLILGNDIKLDPKHIKVNNFYQDKGTTMITLEYANAGVGPITLTFSNSPFELKQWKVIDPQNVEISVSLYGSKSDKPIKDKLFRFRRNHGPLLNKKGK